MSDVVRRRIAALLLVGLIAFAALALALTTTAALVSWTLWEKPFLALKRHFPAPAAARPAEEGERSPARIRSAA